MSPSTLLFSFLRPLSPVRSPLFALAAIVGAAVFPSASQAQTPQQSAPVFASLQQFAGTNGGAGPYGSLAQGTDGSLYGTTYLGGASDRGTVFRVSPAGAIIPLHSFTGLDGSNPQGGLVQSGDGFIYGTTYNGGTTGTGTIFRVKPGTGEFQSLYSFASGDGSNPYAGLVDIGGLLYGTTVKGGSGGAGTLFYFDPSATATPLTVLHAFTGGSDGGNPQAAPIPDGNGNLYGTATTGGDYGGGTVYVYDGEALATLHAFSLGEPVGPAANLILAADGSFYGTTILGGASNDGAIFSITSAGVLKTFYSFGGGTDGMTPQSALIQGADGTFYGTATFGGNGGAGTIYSISQTGILSVLHAFANGTDGGNPQSGLIQAANGSLYGATYVGGNGNGTVYQLSFAGAAGTVQFSSSTYNTTESSGTANLTVSRVNGSSGSISAAYATSDGTANAGTDYVAASGTLTWADGDVADKTIQVTIRNRGVLDGKSRTLQIALSAFGGGAIAGTPTTATLAIVSNDAPATQPTITITSPPADIQVVTGTPLTLAASVTDPDSLLSEVDFFVNGIANGKSTASGPFSTTVTAPNPGTYILTATAIDTTGRQSSSSRTVTIIAASTNDPTPTTNILTDIGGRTLASGTTIILSATAESLNLNGEALGRVDFYADDALLASFDGGGNPITDSAPGTKRSAVSHAVRRTAANGSSSSSTIFKAAFTIPNLDKLINLLTVATTQTGHSQVSSSVSVKATTSTANRPPTAVLKNIANGARIRVGSRVTVPVVVADPDAGTSSTSAYHNGRRTSNLTAPAGVIAKVEYYLNQLKIATSTAPPYTFDVAPPAAGEFLVEAIVTDGAGLSNVADPVTITAFATPTVTLTAGDGTNKTTVTEGGKAKLTVTRDGDLTDPLTVRYKAAGMNVAGTDYKALSGSVTIPAGAASVKLKVKTLDDGVVDGDKVLKVKLLSSADGSYTLGTPAAVKVDIVDVDKN